MNQSINSSPTDLAGSTAIVTGASRGFGRGIADALTAAGARVIGVARSGATVSADAADPATAGRLIDEHQPRTVVLCAGRHHR
jgi:NAD(P)-dependent dehydrogenase (short-subunit alcohol dehydrogenase family)